MKSKFSVGDKVITTEEFYDSSGSVVRGVVVKTSRDSCELDNGWWYLDKYLEIDRMYRRGDITPLNYSDMVNHPPHYTSHPSGIECIQVTEHMSFTIGNAVKYLWRADLKNGLEDLKKAAWYIQREIERREREA